MTHPPIGIDLGTTNSLIACFEEGQPRLLADGAGEWMTPSVVALQEGQLRVGHAALPLLRTAPGHAAAAFKRKMGADAQISLGKYAYSPVDLSSLVLQKLKVEAESRLGCPIQEAVVSVPAYFNQVQREATRAACRIAGITPLALVNEPTAAALAYGLQDIEGESQFLVFDLGGGTFDVTVLEHFDGVMEVRASSGDAHLGGEDFTSVMVELFYSQLEAREEQLSDVARSLVRHYAEEAKKRLSANQVCAFEFELDGVARQITIEPDAFAQAAETLLQRMRAPIHRCLYDAEGQRRHLDRVILVGGATRMPLARRLAAQELGLFPDSTIDPDHAVALGAAVHAALLKEDRALDDVVMTDVSPFSIGIAIHNAHNVHRRLFAPIMERNTPLPASRVETFSAIEPDQRKMRVSVYQGEAAYVDDNVLLGEFHLALSTRRTRKSEGEEVYPEASVRITQDVSGIVEVLAVTEDGRGSERLTLTTHAAQMNEADIQQRMKALAHLKIHPRDAEVNITMRKRLERLFEMAAGADREFILRRLKAFEAALERQDPADIARLRDELGKELDAIEGVYGL